MLKPYSGPADEKCPKYQKLCSKVCPTCKMFVQVRGDNPQTGDPVDIWDCVFPMMAMLMLENTQQQRQTGAAVESMRNELVKTVHASQQVISNQVERFNDGVDRLGQFRQNLVALGN